MRVVYGKLPAEPALSQPVRGRAEEAFAEAPRLAHLMG